MWPTWPNQRKKNCLYFCPCFFSRFENFQTFFFCPTECGGVMKKKLFLKNCSFFLKSSNLLCCQAAINQLKCYHSNGEYSTHVEWAHRKNVPIEHEPIFGSQLISTIFMLASNLFWCTIKSCVDEKRNRRPFSFLLLCIIVWFDFNTNEHCRWYTNSTVFIMWLDGSNRLNLWRFVFVVCI